LAACSSKDGDDRQSSSSNVISEAPVGSTQAAGMTTKAMPLNITQTNVNGTTVTLNSIQVTPTDTLLTMTIDNRHKTEVILASSYGTYIFGPDGAKLTIEPPAENKELEIPPGQSVRAELVFKGALARGGPATLFINNARDMENADSRYPGFRISINLDPAAFAKGEAKKK
jgi:hypothetical protein